MKPQQGQHFDAEDSFGSVIDTVARIAFWGGLGAVLVGAGFLIFTYAMFSSSNPPATVDQAASNIELFRKLLITGSLAVSAGGAFMFWMAELFAGLQLIVAALLFFSPMYLPSIIGGRTSSVGGAALDGLQTGGAMLLAFGFILLAIEVVIRVKERTQHGIKADHLKFGKGIREERDIKNVFMGKCWQLPFCRKFVRERCPIYHSGRTCWRERVGCMCEEEVIRNAMENRTIPKEAVAAAKMIPRNNRLTMTEKFERCRHCVIYNEHQKHKYTLILPMVVLAFIGFYIAFRQPMLDATGAIVGSVDRVVGQASLGKAGSLSKAMQDTTLPFNEILLICFLIIGLAYALKMLEFVIFKLKI